MLTRLLDMYSDFFYLKRFPHKDAFTAAWLLFNFMLPHYTVLIVIRFFPMYFKAFARGYKEFIFGFREWNNPTFK